MDDLDPAAPSGTEGSTDAAKSETNFGIDGSGDLPAGEGLNDLPEAFDVATVDFDIDAAEGFLQACMHSQPHVTYGLGAKIKPGQEPGSGGFTRVDCSGFVREVMRRATDLGDSFPDGSVVQHDWVRKKNFAADSLDSGKAKDGAVRIAFLSPTSTTSGIGHVTLLYNGSTLESHGGTGPDSRPWTEQGWQGKTKVYILSPGA